jgi:hypothetical protein
MILVATIDDTDVFVDVDAKRAVVDMRRGDVVITTLDYTAHNLRILSEHLRDQLSWDGVTAFLEHVDPARSIPDLWWRGRKGIADPFSSL